MVRWNLSFDDVKNCKEKTVFAEERSPQFGL